MELLSTTVGQVIIGGLLVINLWAFLVMANDKRRSTRGHNVKRISEGRMFFMATVFGSVGVYLGMMIFRHKTKKWHFKLGIPMLILQNLATMYVVWVLVA
jgi:uncharacterized membrane protein YsdA (DUF1294 family)